MERDALCGSETTRPRSLFVFGHMGASCDSQSIFISCSSCCQSSNIASRQHLNLMIYDLLKVVWKGKREKEPIVRRLQSSPRRAPGIRTGLKLYTDRNSTVCYFDGVLTFAR